MPDDYQFAYHPPATDATGPESMAYDQSLNREATLNSSRLSPSQRERLGVADRAYGAALDNYVQARRPSARRVFSDSEDAASQYPGW